MIEAVKLLISVFLSTVNGVSMLCSFMFLSTFKDKLCIFIFVCTILPFDDGSKLKFVSTFIYH